MKKIILCMFILVFLAGCSGNQAEELSPAEILLKASGQMKSLEGFQVIIETTGAPAYLDQNGTLTISKMEGNYAAPNKVQAKVRVIAPGLVVEVNVISIGDELWQTNVFTGQWEKAADDWGFNPSALLEGNAGFPAILATDLSELQLSKDVELEEMPGKKMYLITGKMAGENLYDLTTIIGPEPVDAQIWIDPETFDVHRAVLTEYAGDTEKERNWQIDFWDFGNVMEIEAPDI